MINIESNAKLVMQLVAAMRQQLAVFPSDMETEATEWEHQDQNKQAPEVERPDNKSVRVKVDFNPVGARKNRANRILERFARRLIRRLLPRPIRMFQRHVRMGRRLFTRPETVLLPAPVRRLRRFERQFKRVAAGRRTAVMRQLPFGIGRVFGRVRRTGMRQRRQQELIEALTERMTRRARRSLSWRQRREQ